jgi:hypothetical protein
MKNNATFLKWCHLILLFALWGQPIDMHSGEARLTGFEIDGAMNPQKPEWVIRADVEPMAASTEKLIVSLKQNILLHLGVDGASGLYQLEATAIQGDLHTLELELLGQGDVKEVGVEGMLEWAVSLEVEGRQSLVIRMKETKTPRTSLQGTIRVEYANSERSILSDWQPVRFVSDQSGLSGGYLSVTHDDQLSVSTDQTQGLTSVVAESLPPWLLSRLNQKSEEGLHYRFFQGDYDLQLETALADPDRRKIYLESFELTGDWKLDIVEFHFKGVVKVKHAKGGDLHVLGGDAAMKEINVSKGAVLDYVDPVICIVKQGDTLAGIASRYQTTADKLAQLNQDAAKNLQVGQRLLIPSPNVQTGYMARYSEAGSYPLEFTFLAKVNEIDGGEAIHFTTATDGIRPVLIRNIPSDAEVDPNSRIIQQDAPSASNDWRFNAPAEGPIYLKIRKNYQEEDSKLFYAAESWEESLISPGLLRQSFQTVVRIMQGSMTEIQFAVEGEGEIISVESDKLYGWEMEGDANAPSRKLKLKLNEAQTESFTVKVHAQSSLGAFPVSFKPLRLFPENATRFSGWIRVANLGAVRLEVNQASGLSQISPDQLQSQAEAKSFFSQQGNQVFAYRYASTTHELGIRADNILPEISVSELLIYRIGLADVKIEAELELNVREAPVREVQVRLPGDYNLFQIQASELADFFISEPSESGEVILKLVFSKPIMGRRVVALVLEQNTPLDPGEWTLPYVGVVEAKSIRGNLAVTTEVGLRAQPAQIRGLGEIPAGFFPRKIEGVQSAFRLREAEWSASVNIERLEQSVQADVLHLYTIGEGMAYGSSVIHYFISGAPLNSFEVSLPDDYFNLEFTGSDVRDWVKTESGYIVSLHNPVSGAYTLLASYERPFNARGETLTFSGVRPTDAQSEQGYTIVTSAYQFRVNPVSVSASLNALEPTEVPAEHRLFIDAPILAAYHYTALPVGLELELQPLNQGETLDLVVDRASIRTHVSMSGEMVTDATYFIKSQGNAMLPIQLPEDARLWSVTVNQKSAATIQNENGYQIPIISDQSPDALQAVEIKWATRSAKPNRLTAQTAALGVPVVLAEWVIEPDPGHELRFRQGSLLPVAVPKDVSGWAALAQVLASRGRAGGDRLIGFLMAGALGILAVFVWRFAKGKESGPGRLRFWPGTMLGCIAVFALLAILSRVAEPVFQADSSNSPTEIEFLAPVLGANTTLSAELDYYENAHASGQFMSGALMMLAVIFWITGFAQNDTLRKKFMWCLAWVLVCFSALNANEGWTRFVYSLSAFYILHIALPWLVILAKTTRATTSNSVSTAMFFFSMTLGLQDVSAATNNKGKFINPQNVSKASLLEQFVEVHDDRVEVRAQINWETSSAATLDLLREPVVLKSVEWSGGDAKLFLRSAGSGSVHALAASEAGTYEITVLYELRLATTRSGQRFTLPNAPALVHQMHVVVKNREVDLLSDHAITIDSSVSAGGHTEADLVLAPGDFIHISMRPRVRNAQLEKPVYFAEWNHLLMPSAGLVEGFHTVSIRLAQGELSVVKVIVPESWTVADVTSGGTKGWRFDPDASTLSIPLNPPKQDSFLIYIRSQLAAEPLPFERDLGVPSLEGAEREVGRVAVATMNDVQLTDIKSLGMSEIRWEDFSSNLYRAASQIMNGNPIMRRAFRYGEGHPMVVVSADAVSPDLRLVTRQTLSIGEDRTVLGVDCQIDISRAGIFRLRFPLPVSMDVESVNGSSLSHWTEAEQDGLRFVTLHFHDRTMGRSDLQLSIAGPGPDVTSGWAVPRIRFEEASKQTGQLTLSTEPGMRLQINSQEGVVQLDPEDLGLGNKDAVVFRLLHQDWKMSFDIVQLPPWIQVDGMQYVQLSEGRGEVQTRLKYQVKNAGMRDLKVALPANAEGVRFQGEHIADYLSVELDENASQQQWNIELDRRVIGEYILTAIYTLPMPVEAESFSIQGDQALDARLQRGYLAVGLQGRLQASLKDLPSELQTADWQSIPSEWTQSVQAAPTRMGFRLIQPDYVLQLNLRRHEVARLLPAQVEKADLRSVVSDNGMVLTEIRLEVDPGDKRLLPVTLPEGATFWFSLINGHSVWPWESEGQILIPLEAASDPDSPSIVEFLFASDLGKTSGSQLRFDLEGPEFDLPLQNVTWQVFLHEKWQMHRHEGSLQLIKTQTQGGISKLNWDQYFQMQSQMQQEQSRTAEELLNLGNQLMVKGDPRYARQAFERAYGLSKHDAAFNEDARVQLHNLKTQQAFLGLNFRNNFVQNQTGNGQQLDFNGDISGDQMQFKPEDVEQLMIMNSDDVNAAFSIQAERIIRQQEAAVEKPDLLRTTFPQQGKAYTFQQTVQVGDWSKLELTIDACKVVVGPQFGFRFGALMVLGLGLLLILLVSSPRPALCKVSAS